MTIEASETEFAADVLPQDEVFYVADFPEFKITLHNWHGEIIKIVNLMKNRKDKG
jgi:hypothetical protein